MGKNQYHKNKENNEKEKGYFLYQQRISKSGSPWENNLNGFAFISTFKA